MKYSSKKIKIFFHNWGNKQAVFPEHNDQLKQRMLVNLPTRPQIPLIGPSFKFHISSLSFVCLGLACLTLFINTENISKITSYFSSYHEITPPVFTLTEAPNFLESSGVTNFGMNRADDYSNFQTEKSSHVTLLSSSGGSPIEDTREFMKTDYSATIKTRHVDTDGKKIKLLVRGYGGLVNYISLGNQNGFISFAIPKSEFESFHDDLKEIADGRYLIEQQSDVNLLNQKKILETQTSKTNESLQNLKKSLETVTEEHNRIILQIDSNVRFYANEKQTIASQLEKNQNNREDLQIQLTRVNQNIQTNQTKLETENQVFSSQEQSIKSQISSTESALDSLREKDQQFTNTIETVAGNIKLQWVSFTDIIGLYLPKQWLPISFFLLAVVTLISSRYRTVDQEKF
jgi:hypothetical protein